jgi:hypothetical protein
MCAGEMRHMSVSTGKRDLREDYYCSIEAKTASLFAASTEMAGILAGAEEPQIAALRRFGQELGMAFQIVDDVLDFVGDEAQLGKPAGSDLRQGLITLPIICHLEIVEDDTSVSGTVGDFARRHLTPNAALPGPVCGGAKELRSDDWSGIQDRHAEREAAARRPESVVCAAGRPLRGSYGRVYRGHRPG